MLTAERIELFKQMVSNNQSPTNPEDAADYEVVKAMIVSQAMAGQVAQTPSTTVVTPTYTANVPVASVPAVATTLTPTTPVAASFDSPVPSNGSAFTMEDAMKSAMAVDHYLKPKYGQMFIDNEVVNNDPIFVSIDLDSIVVKSSIKAGNPVKYYSTLNGRDCIQGGSWADVVADVQKIDPKARPYFCVDLAMKVAKPICAFDNRIVVDTGCYLGHTTATTNWKDWSRFYQALPTHTGSVFVKLTRQDVKKDSNQWGLLNFEYVTNEQAQQLGLVA